MVLRIKLMYNVAFLEKYVFPTLQQHLRVGGYFHVGRFFFLPALAVVVADAALERTEQAIEHGQRVRLGRLRRRRRRSSRTAELGVPSIVCPFAAVAPHLGKRNPLCRRRGVDRGLRRRKWMLTRLNSNRKSVNIV